MSSVKIKRSETTDGVRHCVTLSQVGLVAETALHAAFETRYLGMGAVATISEHLMDSRLASGRSVFLKTEPVRRDPFRLDLFPPTKKELMNEVEVMSSLEKDASRPFVRPERRLGTESCSP